MWQFLVQKLSGFLTQGTLPKSLAISVSLGLLLGIFPILGVTTLAMTALSLRFSLNLAIMMGLSYLVFPLQILLIIPFMRLGEWLFDVAPLALTLDALQAAFAKSFFGALQDLGAANLLAVAGWLTVAVPLGVMMYKGLVLFFRFWLAKKAA